MLDTLPNTWVGAYQDLRKLRSGRPKAPSQPAARSLWRTSFLALLITLAHLDILHHYKLRATSLNERPPSKVYNKMVDISTLNSNWQPETELNHLSGTSSQNQQPQQIPEEQLLHAWKDYLAAWQDLKSQHQKHTAMRPGRQLQTRARALWLGNLATSGAMFNTAIVTMRGAFANTYGIPRGCAAGSNAFILGSISFLVLCIQLCFEVLGLESEGSPAATGSGGLPLLTGVLGLTLDWVPYVMVLTVAMTMFGVCGQWLF